MDLRRSSSLRAEDTTHDSTNDEAMNIPLTRPWHPRMTPYRVLVMMSGIGLGTAKAILVWRGRTIAPVTLEWIAGVVISLSFQFLGFCESKPEDEVPYYLKWLFSTDCTKVLWAALVPFSASRPTAYRNGESDIVFRPVPSSMHPPMTGYRLLVSAIVVSFGTIKMLCGYLGLSTAANTFDWTFGVVVTSVLYYLGLYENNPDGLLPFLFATNYWKAITRSAYLGLYFAVYTSGIAACIAWCGFWLRVLVSFPYEAYSRPTAKTNITRDNLTPTPIDAMHDYAVGLFFLYDVAVTAAAGIVGLILLLRPMKRVLKVMHNQARLLVHFILRRFLSRLYGTGISPDFDFLRTRSASFMQILDFVQIYAKICVCITVYTLCHLIGASFFVITTVVLFGFCIRCAFTLFLSDFLALRICCGIVVCLLPAMGVPTMYMIYVLLRSLFRALRLYYETKDLIRSFTTIH